MSQEVAAATFHLLFGRLLSRLRAMFMHAMTAMSVMKHVQERTGEDEQIRKIAEHVQPMLGHEQESADQ